MKAVLIIGTGQFGSIVAKRMEELRCEVMVVDHNEERINDILPFVTSASIGDSTNEEFLRSLGVGNYDLCIVALGGYSSLHWKQHHFCVSLVQRRSYLVQPMTCR